tara:strand:+ start:2112 stop:2504 length:393 start_codon:yes stop_codon:yes gene_type:complete
MDFFPKTFISFVPESQISGRAANLNEPNAAALFLKINTMGATIITTEDLMEFKMELLEDIKDLLQNKDGQSAKKWLKSNEVRELLGISPGTLQNLRINGTLPYTRIGGILYYDQREIMEVLERNKVNPRF